MSRRYETGGERQDPWGGRQDRRPWFGPKRIGVGLRPQTWPGYLVTGLVVAVVIVIIAAARGRWQPGVLIAFVPLVVFGAIAAVSRR